MKYTFPGFQREGLDFLRDLAENNDREWFTPRKAIYEETLRRPMIELVSAVHREMLRFAPDYVGEPEKCLYRIYRDTRFSKDKTPYKTHVGALLWRNGSPKNEGSGFYFAISPTAVEIAGGLYMPDPAATLAVRTKIAADPDAFRATYESRKTKKLMGDLKGETLSRVPKGFDPSDPAADLLRHKRWMLYTELDPALALTPKVLPEIVSRLEAVAPLVHFLDGALLGRKKQQKRDELFFRQ
jgi:uncharacterized protein (TIGR02453 family)